MQKTTCICKKKLAYANRGYGPSPQRKAATMYLAEIETRIAGIPAIIGVTAFERHGAIRHADSDLDSRGFIECDWEVLDRRGRPAPWLARKVTDGMATDIDSIVAEYYQW